MWVGRWWYNTFLCLSLIWTMRVRMPAEARDVPSTPNVQTFSEANPVSYSMGNSVVFLGWSGRTRLAPRSRITVSLPPIPPHAFHPRGYSEYLSSEFHQHVLWFCASSLTRQGCSLVSETCPVRISTGTGASNSLRFFVVSPSTTFNSATTAYSHIIFNLLFNVTVYNPSY